MIRLRPLRDDEYPAWQEAHRAEYERGLVAFARMTPEEARAKAGHDVPAVLPDGIDTADTWIWAVEDDERRVGTVFLGVRGGGAFLYDITIDATERGRGHGRAAMLALEDEVRRLGYDGVTLNVWGGNAIARRLYESLGYVELAVSMRKQL